MQKKEKKPIEIVEFVKPSTAAMTLDYQFEWTSRTIGKILEIVILTDNVYAYILLSLL